MLPGRRCDILPPPRPAPGTAAPPQLQLDMQLFNLSPQTAAAERFWQNACEVWQAPRSSGLVILSHWLSRLAWPQSP